LTGFGGGAGGGEDGGGGVELLLDEALAKEVVALLVGGALEFGEDGKVRGASRTGLREAAESSTRIIQPTKGLGCLPKAPSR
jgi:hypothetical protein